MNTATHRYNRPICAEEGNQIYKDTIMGQEVRARGSSPAAAASLYCSSVLPFTIFIYFDLQETRWCQKKLHFSHYFFASFFSKQQCFFSCATTPFFSTEHLWIRAPWATIGWQSRARCTRYHKVEPQQTSSFWVSAWKAPRIKHVFSLTFTCCWVLTHKIVFSLVVNMC